jgi:regulation of enolase protein 1 (concanavalin A-like superfamily)
VFNFTVMNRPLGVPAKDVAAVDVNGDHKLDLVVASAHQGESGLSFVDGTVSVLPGNGDGTFGVERDYRVRPGAWRVVTGDFNRDGLLDIATANRSAVAIADCGPALKTWDSVSILNGNGDGTFAAASDFSIGNQRSLTSTRYRNTASSLSVVDLTGDGFGDLVASDGVIFTSNSPDPNWAPTVTASASTPAANHSVTLSAVAEDVDQDMLSYSWADSAGMSIAGVPNPCITPSTLGVHTFTVTVNDGRGHTASSSVTVDFGGAAPPPPGTTTIAVVSPTAGQNVPAGTPFTIKWHVEDSAEAIVETTAYFSEDDGVTWQRILNSCFQVGPWSGPGVPDSRDQQCSWRNPGPPSTHMRILVAGQDDADNWIATAQSGAFTISPEPGAVPDPWRHQDIGAVATAGSAMFDHGSFSVQGSGADIWGTADEFHYVYNAAVDPDCCAPGEPFEITTKVNLVQNVAAWTKAGLMIRDGLGASARHASLFVTPGKGLAFQRRTAPGGTSISTSGPLIAAPVWLKLTMHQTTIAAYYRKNLTDPWTLLGEQAFSAWTEVEAGLAVTSHSDGVLANASFSDVDLERLTHFTSTDIGTTGGTTTTDDVITTMTSKGADIWGTADQFRCAHTSWSGGDGSIAARVVSVQNVNAWTKAGVMFREDVDPNTIAANAKYVFLMATPGKGVTLQYRETTGGSAASIGALVPQTAPVWLRLTKRTDRYSAAWSKDGVNWFIFAAVQIPMRAVAITTGLALTSHNSTTAATAVFDDLIIDDGIHKIQQ